jgi:predicted ester cyclase
MSVPSTATFYRRYISCLNDRRIHELVEFVNEELSYNGKSMRRVEYENLLAGDFAAIPDLYFDIHLLVVDEDQIACRLNFVCAPQSTFLGLLPNGKTISFSEHVFYRLSNGRISEVWSLIDQSAVEQQFAS